MRSAITQTSCRSLALALYDAVDRTLFWLNPELASHFHSAGARSRFTLEPDEDESASELLLFELLLLLSLLADADVDVFDACSPTPKYSRSGVIPGRRASCTMSVGVTVCRDAPSLSFALSFSEDWLMRFGTRWTRQVGSTPRCESTKDLGSGMAGRPRCRARRSSARLAGSESADDGAPVAPGPLRRRS